MTSVSENNAIGVERSSGARYAWLFSPTIDLSVFGGSALISMALLAYGAYAGLLTRDTPEWAWVPFVLLIDVAHVYATGFRVYFDAAERSRRPLLYYGAPIAAFLIGTAIYSESPDSFWRVLAYLAVFHFVRQQYGWVAMYRAKAKEPLGWQKWIDVTTIYLVTIHPLVYWHASLPRNFWWFKDWDFYSIPSVLVSITAPLYWLAIVAYTTKAIWQWRTGRANPGKDLVVLTTMLCWRLGIITFNSDYAFTVTNVVIHGVPYFALIALHARNHPQAVEGKPVAKKRGWLPVLTTIIATAWFLAFAEELLWDRFVWQERSWLFGNPIEADSVSVFWLAPLLATPQITHYILDGFIWKRKNNPELRALDDSQAIPSLSEAHTV